MPSYSPHPLQVSIVQEQRYPQGLGICMQFEFGYLVLTPDDARRVASGLLDAAKRVERMAGGE